MFLILQNDKFFSFWSNKPGDIFVDATIKNLFLDEKNVKFIFFKEIIETPSYFEITGNNITIDGKEFKGELFFENGKTLILC